MDEGQRADTVPRLELHQPVMWCGRAPTKFWERESSPSGLSPRRLGSSCLAILSTLRKPVPGMYCLLQCWLPLSRSRVSFSLQKSYCLRTAFLDPCLPPRPGARQELRLSHVCFPGLHPNPDPSYIFVELRCESGIFAEPASPLAAWTCQPRVPPPE